MPRSQNRRSNSSDNEKATPSPKQTSADKPQLPPLGSDGKLPLPPLGPDGKPLYPPLGPDGKPLYPPLGPDGNPLPPPKLGPDGRPMPPPILGPDGKELPRPTDKDGRPLPVYITKEGKAVLDENGQPIALKFDAEGKPIPLQPPTNQEVVVGGDGYPRMSAGNKNIAGIKVKLKDTDGVPRFLLWMGVTDLVLSLFTTGLEGYLLSEWKGDGSKTDEKLFYCILTALILSGLGCVFAIVLIVSTNMNKTFGVYIWGGTTIISLVAMLVIAGMMASSSGNNEISGYKRGLFALTLAVLRSLFLCLTGLYYCEGPRGKEHVYINQRPPGAYPQQQVYYPTAPPAGHRNTDRGSGGSKNKTVIVQQPVVMPMPAYGYGHPHGGFGHYGRGYGYGYPDPYWGEAAILGFAAGSMMGGPGYTYPYYDSWGYDSFGYDGGFY
ncbi:unnamed protein product [Orchesella dallaii]|uniref:Uncharacterized protein n=1 Tax=Orchesella dallaii TaxID=48710 RepID=A0ABP1RD70_9HEXA